jgi:hypothetical protein
MRGNSSNLQRSYVGLKSISPYEYESVGEITEAGISKLALESERMMLTNLGLEVGVKARLCVSPNRTKISEEPVHPIRVISVHEAKVDHEESKFGGVSG